MSGHNGRPGSQPHRALRPTIWAAAAAVILLALAACSTTTTATTSAVSAPSTASFGAVGHRAALTGAGSTFVAPFFDLAFAKYHQQHPGVSISYCRRGQRRGHRRVLRQAGRFRRLRRADDRQRASRRHGRAVRQVPVALGGEGVVYNLYLPGGQRLHLTGPVIARIFLGQITRWNDPAITALNPGIDHPGRADHRGPPLRRQRHDLHLQRLPVQRRPGLGGQGRQRQDPQLAGRGRSRRQRRRRPPRSTAPPSPSDTSNKLFHGACCCRSPRSATGPATTHPVHRVHHRRRRPKTPHHPDRLLDRQPARRQQLPHHRLQLGARLHPPAQPGHRPELVTMLDWLTHSGQAYAAANGYVPLPPQISSSPTPCSSRSPAPAGNTC